MFEDIIERKKRDLNERINIEARKNEILELFGDYCEAHAKDLKKYFKYVEIDNRMFSCSNEWYFVVSICQSDESKRNGEIYYIRDFSNKLKVYTPKWNIGKEFEYDLNYNDVQLTSVIKNALRYLFKIAYKLPK